MTTSPHLLRSILLERIRAGTDSPIADDECFAPSALSPSGFNDLALAVFRHQYECNDPYRAYCERRGATPAIIRDWTEIPAVPTDAFKAVPLVCGDPAEAVAVFRTSGTTAGAERRGEHYFRNLELYGAALLAGFRSHLLPDGARLRMISLVPTPEEAPHSSLSHMIAEVTREFSAEESGSYLSGNGIDFPRTLATLRDAETSDAPLCLLGTSFAFVHLVDGMRSRREEVLLPHGSRIMDTGGFKGRSREVSRDELYAGVQGVLGIAPEWCVNEYGMTEMSSQFYDTVAGDPEGAVVADRRHHGPPWVRTRAVDPETLALLPDGQQGILRHWDLANLDSVVTLQTEDLGVCFADEFRVLGRVRGAEARGCSIAVDELLSAMSGDGRAG